ncbi:MAG: PQQ-dependent sugar dehydrogenase [Chthoniobacteraceae bacterium]
MLLTFLLAIGLLTAPLAHATFHLMQIEQVIGGVNGDTSVQAIQLRMRSPGQSFVSGAKLFAYDATGSNPVLLIQFPSNVSHASSGSTILIATSNFSTHTNPALTPDFTFTNPIPSGYLAAGRIVYTDSGNNILWSVAFGGSGYTGSDTGATTNDSDGNFAPAFANALPTSTGQALLFQGAASAASTNNAADYAVTSGAATFSNNAGATGVVIDNSVSIPAITRGAARVGLQSVATGLVAPTDLVSANDGTGRLFVVDQAGKVWLIKNGQLVSQPFLDLSSRLVTLDTDYDERGLLGLAFHPGFADPNSPGYRKLYTYSSEPVSGSADFTVTMTGSPDHQSVVTEWQVSAANADLVDTSKRREVLRVDEPEFNHNGGKLAFRSSDGYLYISLGDGGAANDVGDGHNVTTGNGQDLHTVLGKILRIDPLAPALTTGSSDATSANGNYRVPASNPLVGADGVDEIYAYGLRNPFRFSFDIATGVDRLVAGDVGQNSVEEVDLVELGKNYGWNKKEGSFLFDPTTADISVDLATDPALTDPVLEYGHSDGSAVIGGYVYRGDEIPELAGKYVFGDFSQSFEQPAGCSMRRSAPRESVN